jgi:hypothetical protein
MKKVKYMFFIALVIGLLITRVYKNIADAKGNMDYYMLADYDRVIRETRLREDGLQYPDSKKVMERMVELNANTYAHLIWRSEADWKALPEMAIEAEKAGIKLIAYLVPPSEGDVLGKPVPFGYDYVMWAEASNRLFQKPPFSYYAVFDLTIENQRNETLYLTEVSFYLVDIYGKKYRNLSLLPNDLKKAAQDGGKEPSDFVFDKVLPYATVGKHIVFPLPTAPIQSLNMEDAKKENNITVILWEGVIQEITGN